MASFRPIQNFFLIMGQLLKVRWWKTRWVITRVLAFWYIPRYYNRFWTEHQMKFRKYKFSSHLKFIQNRTYFLKKDQYLLAKYQNDQILRYFRKFQRNVFQSKDRLILAKGSSIFSWRIIYVWLWWHALRLSKSRIEPHR